MNLFWKANDRSQPSILSSRALQALHYSCPYNIICILWIYFPDRVKNTGCLVFLLFCIIVNNILFEINLYAAIWKLHAYKYHVSLLIVLFSVLFALIVQSLLLSMTIIQMKTTPRQSWSWGNICNRFSKQLNPSTWYTLR